MDLGGSGNTWNNIYLSAGTTIYLAGVPFLSRASSSNDGIKVGNGSANAIITSNGIFDLVLQTGNPTTGNITLTDGVGGNITIAPNGTGKTYLKNSVSSLGALLDTASIATADKTFTFPNLSGTFAVAVSDTATVDLTFTGGTISADVIGGSSVQNIIFYDDTVTVATETGINFNDSLDIGFTLTDDPGVAVNVSADFIRLTTLGDILYHDGLTNERLAGNTTAVKNWLSQTGSGLSSAAPVWETLTLTDVGWTVAPRLTALGTDQAGALALLGNYSFQEITTISAGSQEGVRLPVPTLESIIAVVNANKTDTLFVYPSTGTAINGQVANASISLPPLGMGLFIAASVTEWYMERGATFTLTAPAALGTADAGTSLFTSRSDHVHPSVNLATGSGVTGTLADTFFPALTGAVITTAGSLTTALGSFTSLQLKTALTDETGSGLAVFATSPTLTTSLITDSATFALLNSVATTVNAFGATTTLNLGASATMILNFGGSTTASEFRFLEPSGSGTNYTAFKAVAQVASHTYSLPPALVAGGFLKDVAGDGVLTWVVPPGGGDVSKVGTPVNNQMAVWTGDGTLEGTSDFTYDGTSLNLITAKNFQIAGTTILADAAGVTTLSGIDALDPTTEATIEGAIDTLANLVSIQGRTVTLADAGANAFFGWDDTAGAYENLTQGEALAILGTIPVANGGTGQTTEAEAIGELIQALSVDVLPDPTADYFATYDASADTGKKILLNAHAPRGHIWGLIMSNAADTANDITVVAGEAVSEDGKINMVLGSAITKQLDATWAVGDAAGGLNTGVEAISTWYEVHLIRRSDTGVVDVMFTTTANRATLPAGYDSQRRIGWIRNDGAGNILQFTQVNDNFTLTTPVNDISNTATASATTQTLTAPPSTLARFRAACLGNTSVNGANGIVFSEIVETDTAPTTSNGFLSIGAGDFAIMGTCHVELRVSTTSTIRDRAITATGSMAYDASTYGWVDTRLRLSSVG